MPELSRFFGIVITMYARDHPPPHFHARYNDREALVSSRDARTLGGPCADAVILTWLTAREKGLV